MQHVSRWHFQFVRFSFKLSLNFHSTLFVLSHKVTTRKWQDLKQPVKIPVGLLMKWKHRKAASSTFLFQWCVTRLDGKQGSTWWGFSCCWEPLGSTSGSCGSPGPFPNRPPFPTLTIDICKKNMEPPSQRSDRRYVYCTVVLFRNVQCQRFTKYIKLSKCWGVGLINRAAWRLESAGFPSNRTVAAGFKANLPEADGLLLFEIHFSLTFRLQWRLKKDYFYLAMISSK